MPKDNMCSFRLTHEEMAALKQAASGADMTITEYVRKLIALHPIGSVLEKPQYGLVISTPHLQYGIMPSWSEAGCIQNDCTYTISGSAVCQ